MRQGSTSHSSHQALAAGPEFCLCPPGPDTPDSAVQLNSAAKNLQGCVGHGMKAKLQCYSQSGVPGERPPLPGREVSGASRWHPQERLRFGPRGLGGPL